MTATPHILDCSNMSGSPEFVLVYSITSIHTHNEAEYVLLGLTLQKREYLRLYVFNPVTQGR